MQQTFGFIAYPWLILVSVASFSAFVLLNYSINWTGLLIFSIITLLTGILKLAFMNNTTGSLNRDIHFSLSFLCFFYYGAGTVVLFNFVYALFLLVARWNSHGREKRVSLGLLNLLMCFIPQAVILGLFGFLGTGAWTIETGHLFALYGMIIMSSILAETMQMIIGNFLYSRMVRHVPISIKQAVVSAFTDGRTPIYHALIEGVLLVMGLLAINRFLVEQSVMGIAFVLLITYVLVRFMINAYYNASDLKQQKISLLESNIALKSLNSKMLKLNRQALKSLSATLEMKDIYTAGHSKRVAYYAFLVGKEMGLSKQELRTLYYGGLVHDIGKMAVKELILNKPGRVTPEEFEEIKRHPAVGSEWIRDYMMPMGDQEEFAKIYEIVRHHHERFDGKGYPDRLRGNDIPCLARLLAVVDTFDAMTSVRPYRAAFSFEQAYDEIVRQVGKQFCPTMVSWFCVAYQNKRWTRAMSSQVAASRATPSSRSTPSQDAASQTGGF